MNNGKKNRVERKDKNHELRYTISGKLVSGHDFSHMAAMLWQSTLMLMEIVNSAYDFLFLFYPSKLPKTVIVFQFSLYAVTPSRHHLWFLSRGFLVFLFFFILMLSNKCSIFFFFFCL